LLKAVTQKPEQETEKKKIQLKKNCNFFEIFFFFLSPFLGVDRLFYLLHNALANVIAFLDIPLAGDLTG
jgi:hypothetical protein